MLWSLFNSVYHSKIIKYLKSNNKAFDLGDTKSFEVFAVIEDAKLDGKLDVKTILVSKEKLKKDEKELPFVVYPHHFSVFGKCSFDQINKDAIYIDLTGDSKINYAAQLFISQQSGIKISKQNNVYAPYFTLKFANTSSLNEFLKLSLSYLNKFWNARA